MQACLFESSDPASTDAGTAGSWALRALASIVVALCTLWFAPGIARAQNSASDKAMAEMLFNRGLGLMRKGQFVDACKQLEQSQQVERGIGTMLYLAECYENLGRTASAWAMFREAASEARAQGQNDRANAGSARADRIEPQLSKLTISVAAAGTTTGLTVLRNGVVVPAGVWGLASPTDPGEQRIEASAPNRKPWSVTAMLPAGGAIVSVDVPELIAVAPQPAPLTAAGSEAPAPLMAATGGSVSSKADRTEPWHLQKPLAYVLGGVGVVALGVGAVFGGNAIAKHNDEQDACASSGCTVVQAQRANQFNRDAHDAATLSNVFVISGAALLAAGVVLYLTAPSEATLQVSLRSHGLGAELALGGTL